MTPFFREFYDYFRTTRAWAEMERTTEGTGWHREANVAVHTAMTIDYYETTFAPFRDEYQQDIAMFSLLFHDIGKPKSEIQTEKEGVVRNQYLGHEERSADHMIFLFRKEDEMRKLFIRGGDPRRLQYDWNDIARIAFIIERHLPYGLKKAMKVQRLKDEIEEYLGHNEEIFFDVLRSDSNGRISDNHADKLKDVEDWITEFRK